MLTSMTGFGSKEADALPFGKISVELRSSNHKFLEIVLHLPEGFLSLEDRIKKEIESRVKRGRITCVININGSKSAGVFINDNLLKNYLSALKNIKKKFGIGGEINLDTLIHLPGVLSLAESTVPKERIWPGLKTILAKAVESLAKTRQKEGRALYKFLKDRAGILKSELETVKIRYKAVSQQKISKLNTPEERSSFLKDMDISEELERLEFHIKNFSQKLSLSVPVGKELDFIAQEMQREANTTGAKSCDSVISSKVIQLKSQIEKIREQVQNIE
jgi:uncharacterized protein (TIGR00255 family)